MRNISERNMLLRAQGELPIGLNLVTDEFREGWCFVQRANAERLENKIRAAGWSCIRIADGVLRSGVGSTLKEATANALKLTLRHISAHFNAVEVEHIEITQYPWFFLVRVRVYPYLIQQGAILPVADDAAYLSTIPRRSRPAYKPAAPFPPFAVAMPQLKQMLISSPRAAATKAQ